MKFFYVLLIIIFIINQPVYSQEVSILSKGCSISGTLEVPDNAGPVDVVLLIAGSGPTDRDGNSNFVIGKSNYLKMLAEVLYKNGIASLRYDKRGVGKSCAANQADLRYEDYVDDAVEWLKYLKNDKRFKRVIIGGHSEGALIGTIAAQKVKCDKVISLCGAAEPANEIILEQLSRNKMNESILQKCSLVLDSLKNGNTVSNIDSLPVMLFKSSVQPYLISWFKYDPCSEIAKVTIPVLIIGGKNDIQVLPEDAVKLQECNKNAEMKIIENMTHIFKVVVTTDMQTQLASYANPALPVSEEFVDTIVKFIKK